MQLKLLPATAPPGRRGQCGTSRHVGSGGSAEVKVRSWAAVQGKPTTREGNMGENQDFSVSLQDSKAAYVLSNVAEVVERILTFVPTKSLLRIAR